MIIEKDWFHNERSYRAFLYAVSMIEKLNDLRAKGALIIKGDSICSNKGQFVVELDGVDSIVGFKHDHGMYVYAGWCTDCESGKISMTMKEVKETFDKFKAVMPKDIISVGKLI